MSGRHIHLASSAGTGSLTNLDVGFGEYSVNWRNIIFLPFNRLWQFFIVCTVTVNVILVIYDIIYDDRKEMEHIVDGIFYFFYVALLFDTVLSLIHRNVPKYACIREYQPKPLVYLFLDIISLLPVYEIYLLIKAASRFHVETNKMRDLLRLKMLLRAYSIYDFFSTAAYHGNINIVLIISVRHYLSLIIITHVVAAFWYYIGCWKCPELNWTVNLKNMVFDDENPMNWFIICYTTIGNTIAHNFRGNIRGETLLEALILTATMMFGFITHYMIYFGQLTNAYIKCIKRQFLFVDNLTSIKKVLSDINIETKWQEKAMEYYSVFWEKRFGIKDMPSTFKLLPIPLQKEVTVDIFWEALRHSHIYGKEDISFKRALSLEMKSEFCLPGDYVYRLGKVKSKMVYIVNGILQVLTAEDEESPIISFSSGTILGEMACLLPTKCIANVRCATYCELHTLSMDGLYRALKYYPKKTKILQEALYNRIKKAREVYEYSKMQESKRLISEFSNEEDTQETCIKWMKNRWRELVKLQRSKKKEVVEIKVNPCYTTEYLDLLVLSEKVELKMQVVCLRGSCPFLMEPGSSFRRCVIGLVLLSVIFQCLLLPYYIAFQRRIPNTLFVICFLLDCIYFLDIYMKLSTAIRENNLFISESTTILMERLKDISFMIDIIAVLPIDYISAMFGISHHLRALLKLNRLLKLHSVIFYFNTLEKNISFSSLNVRLVKYLFLFSITSYWMTCLAYAFVCFEEVCYYYGWYNYNLIMEREAGLTVHLNGSAELASTYYTVTNFLGYGVSNQFQYVTFDLLTHHMLVMLGYYIISFCFAELCAIFELRLEKKRKYRDYINRMAEFIKHNKISGVLKQRMMSVVTFWWEHNENAEIIGEDGILNDATNELKDKTVKYRIRACLARVPLFQYCDDKILNMVTQVCILKTLPCDFQIVAANHRYTWMHVVLRGYCKMKSVMAGDHERNVESILRSGDAFPVIEVLHRVESLVSVTTTTAVEIICIKYSDIMEILLANPAIGKEMSAALKTHFEAYERPLLRKRGRLPEMIPEEHSLGQGVMFTYEIYDDDNVDPKEIAYKKPFQKLGKWYFLRYFFLRKTIDPQKPLFFCLETFRCIFAIVRVFLGLTYFSLLTAYRKQLQYLLRFLDFTCFLDFYVRLHCQYYNELGILVTHPWYTAKHYIKTSFMLDLFATLPFRQLQIDQLLGFLHRENTYTFLALISRPWQLHRLLGFINYFESNIQRTSNILHALKHIVVVVTVLLIMTVLVQVVTCTIEPPDSKGHVAIHCLNDTWLHSTPFEEELTSVVIYVECLYVAVSIFVSSTCGAFTARQISDGRLIFGLCVISFVLRWYIFAKVTSYRIGGNVNLTIYQERMKSFVDFVKAEYIDEDLINESIEYHRYCWKKVQSNNITKTFKRFTADLHEDLVFNLYGSTLELVSIFQGADNNFYRHLGIHLEIKHYKKDSEIIRCNDVQGLLFFVYKGKVDIVIAKQKMCTLGRGGIFGCLEKQGLTRQTIAAIAKVHVDLLAINSNLLHSIVGKHANVADQLKQRNILHHEFIEGKLRVYYCSDTSHSKLFSNYSIVTSWFRQLYNKTRILINQNDLWYTIWNYIVSVHIASLNSLGFMFYTVMTDVDVVLTPLAFSIIHITDLIFIIKIYIGFHLMYVHPESGILIKDLQLIRMQYLKSVRFWVDLLTCFPFHLILYFTIQSPLIIKYSLANRVFRCIFLVQYYNYCEYKLQVKAHLRWTSLFYWICINLQFMTCLWWLIACYDGQCHYLKSTFFEDLKDYVKAEPGLDSIILAYTYIINLFTTTGLRDVAPMNLWQILISIVILCSFQLSTVALASEFATLLEIGQYTQSNYEYNINKLRKYLQGRDLSPPIVDKVWKYSLQLWQRQRGEWMPTIITEAPAFLKQDLLTALYGYHLHNHYLFSNTHVDFIRQLVVHINRCVFFPGNFLAEKGDIDGNMYFIHDGDVEVYDKHGNNEILTTVLTRGNAFGEEHGLFNKPHKFSYKARSTVDALILKRSNWEYLLEWFPASHEEILQKAAENGLSRI